MNTTLINGAAIAAAVKENLRVQIDALSSGLHLAAVCIGDDESLRAFVALKQKAAQAVGIDFSSFQLDPADLQAAETTLRWLAADESVHGIFIELPLPSGWQLEQLTSLIPPAKDVDALTRVPLVSAPAVKALQYVLHAHEIDVRGVKAAVVGHGFLVGKPIARWLRDQGAEVDIIELDTPEPSVRASRADLVISGVGKPGLVTAEWVKEGATVIDFGYARSTSSGQANYVGDIDFTSVQKKAGILSPVPGGMGPLVIAAVLENLVELATK